MHIFKCSIYIECQLPNDLTRVRKRIRSIESLDPMLLPEIAKVESDEDLTSDFEAMAACILPHEPVGNKKAYSNKNE